MASANVRISAKSRDTLRRLAREEGKRMQSILDEAIERYRCEKFLRDANADFAAFAVRCGSGSSRQSRTDPPAVSLKTFFIEIVFFLLTRGEFCRNPLSIDE